MYGDMKGSTHVLASPEIAVVCVNAIAPGWIATPLTTALRGSPERSQAILDRTPLKRWGQPSDLVGGVLYLCAPAASFVTRTILAIDGGYAIS